MKQGQGANTPRKESAFRGIFYQNLTVHLGLEKRFGYCYHHFDLYAGSGYNDKVECDGSPVVFLQRANGLGVENFAAHFVDSDRRQVQGLLSRIQDSRCTIYHGDNSEFIQAIPDLIEYHHENPKKALGSILCDPNGCDLPIQKLIKLSKVCPRLDLILNYPARIWKRERGAGIRPELYLDDLLVSLNKQDWLIQDPLRSDPHEWMILIGRNFPMNDWPKMRIYKLHSPKGVEIVRKSYSLRESAYRLF